MTEVFRFGVVRAATKAESPQTVSLAPPVIGGASTVLSFAQQLARAAQMSAARSNNETTWMQLEIIAAQFLASSGATILNDPLWTVLGSLKSDLQALAAQSGAAITTASIQAIFQTYPGATAASVATYQPKLSNLFLALIIVRRTGPSGLGRVLAAANTPVSTAMFASTPTLPDVSTRLGACTLVTNGPGNLAPKAGASAADALTAYQDALNAALNATVLIPPGIFGELPKPVLGVGFRELNVVKQNIRRYQAAEIARIENILKGESRSHTQRHKLSTETDTTEEVSTTTETDKELTSSDHTDIKNQAEDEVAEATKIDAGVHAQYSGPSFKLQTDLNVSYSKSDQNTKQYSSDTAKDVTQKSVSKVTELIVRTQTTKIIEAFYETERQKFDNTNSATNVSGVYQWIEKVYLSQVFNLGRHMVIDITVPEPGANLLALATATSAQQPPPVQPHPLGPISKDPAGNPILDIYGQLQAATPLNPLDVNDTPGDPNFYGTWVSYYGATGVTPPPPNQTTVSAGKPFDYEDDTDKSAADTIQIPDGYGAVRANVVVSGMRNDNVGASDVFVTVTVGSTAAVLNWPTSNPRSASIYQAVNLTTTATGVVSYTMYGRNMDQMVVEIELVCNRQQGLMDQWKLQTYEKIVDAYKDLQQNYTAAMSARKMETQTVGALGAADTPANRLTERVELKRSCIAIMDNNDATVAGTTAVQLNPAVAPPIADSSNPQLPEPVLDVSQALGARVRWFEQAFEWENIAYVSYPYFWGRRSKWVPNFALTNADPLFLSFLQAGYARVVVPVRLGFEKAVHFYLHTGLPWLGGDLPPVGDDSQNPLYLDVAEEIKNLTGGGYSGETDVPVGDPWEYVLPTTLIQLRDDGSLPEWHRTLPPSADPSDPTYASDAPDEPWTWVDGPPPATAPSSQSSASKTASVAGASAQVGASTTSSAKSAQKKKRPKNKGTGARA